MDPKSVDSFEELSQKFLEEFHNKKDMLKTPQKFMASRGVKEANRGSCGSGKLTHLVKDIRQNNQRNKKPGRSGVKVKNMIRQEENRKRSFKEKRSGVMIELTFPAIARSQLMDEPIILEGIIEGNQVQRILVDRGSSSEIMYEYCFRNLGVNIRSSLKRCRILMIEEGEGLASLMGYPYKCFLRFMKECSQIRMAEGDEEKTGFYTEEGIDPTMSSFGVMEGRFLGHMVIKEGLRADPGRIHAIILSPTPRSRNQIQSLFLQLTAIGKFISKLAELKHPIHEARMKMEKQKNLARQMRLKKLSEGSKGN
nr:hypothetical protein [Tanacetum cinerariifolium]